MDDPMIVFLRKLADDMESGKVNMTYDNLEYEIVEIEPDSEGWRQYRSGPRQRLRIHWERVGVKSAGKGESSSLGDR